jgi:hypothetical protein
VQVQISYFLWSALTYFLAHIFLFAEPDSWNFICSSS